MTQPWKEDWTLDADVDERTGGWDLWARDETFRPGTMYSLDEAKLAAVAPEMMRIILTLACYRNCEFCDQKIDRGFVPGSKGDIHELHPYWHTHSPRCPLRLVCEKAGIPTAVSGEDVRRSPQDPPRDR